MKIILLIILMLLFILFGIIVYLYYLYRYRLFKDLVYISKYLKNNITFNKDNIGNILTNSFQNINSTSKFIIKNNHGILSKILGKSDNSLLSDFFASLGKGDVEYEINNINYFENIFVDLEGKAKDNLSKNGIMYLKLIIGIGLIICIILI